MLIVIGEPPSGSLAELWADALRDMVIRHPDPRSLVELELTDGRPPRLCFRLDVGHDTTDPSKEMRPLNISTVSLTYFPGVAVARAWVAAAWTSYTMHEALELVTIGDLVTRAIDPHGPDIAYDRCIRCGIPTVLTPETLLTALTVVMTPEDARALIARGDS